jgi:DGQHR domain-containing protein
MAGNKKRSKAKRRKPIDPRKLEKRRQRWKLRSVFSRIGFSQIQSDSIEFTFDGRTGELDDIFLQENVIVVCEYTVGKAVGEHVSKKSILFSKIMRDPVAWAISYGATNPDFQQSVDASGYKPTELRVRIIYASTEGVSEQIEDEFKHIYFLDGTRLRYFDSLSHTIHNSARHEFFKYLKLDYSEIGPQARNPKNSSRSFSGHLLPEAHSGYPPGFKVVSFYAEPDALLALSYVLRQDSWRDADGLYQRILIRGKIARMRRYLVNSKRVFVNNIIVTLPETATLNDPTTGKNIDAATLDRTAQVSISIPYSANMIGLVDGQHRVFCYYEGKDPLEREIASLRMRQNLLVTGLVFPEGWTDSRKREFEAQLFLEINDNQARAKSALKQSIELILNPYSNIAIAKEITNHLALKGPLEDLLQTSFFDPPQKIKTTSIVSYGLRPLVKFDGDDTLFAAWPHPQKGRLQLESTMQSERKTLLSAYVRFCVECINAFLIAMKLSTGPDKWNLVPKKRRQFLTPTVINGFFVCLRRLARDSKLSTRESYERKLKGIDAFSFAKYKSSGWKALGDKLYEDYFER